MSKRHEMGTGTDREWEAQERALQEERARGAATHPGAETSDGALVRSYRVLARALRRPVQEGLPPDFAAEVARMARERQQKAMRASVESRVVRALGAALIAAIAVFSVMNGAAWLSLVDLDSTAVQWLLTAAGCVGLATLLPGRARRIHRAR